MKAKRRRRNPGNPPLRTAHGWALVFPAPDVRGRWLAHCLDFDVMSQGTNPRHALEMLVEAIVLVMKHELDQGRDPLALKPVRRRAEWARLEAVFRAGTLVDDMTKIPAGSIFATQVVLFAPATSATRPKVKPVKPALYVAA